MGAYSILRAFDYQRYQQLIAPALRQFLDTGECSAELQIIWDALYQKNLSIESQIPERYQKLMKNSEILNRLREGLKLDIAQFCTQLDADLSVKHEAVNDLLQSQSGSKGGCGETECSLHHTCPFNYLPPNKPYALTVMQLFQQMIQSVCLKTMPELVLGKPFQLADLAWWYGNEVGLEYDDAEQFFADSQDQLVLLLARLCKRGSLWGWADGGYGEGLLGWLNPSECLELTDSLAAYDLSPQAAVSDDILDPYLIDEVIPAMRARLAHVQLFVAESGAQGLGVLLSRE